MMQNVFVIGRGARLVVNVQLLVSIEVTLDELGLPQEFIATEPDQETLTEVTAFVDSLAVHDQITDKPDEATPQQTHYVERQNDGRRFLKRRGFN